MRPTDHCPSCNEELKFGKQAIIQSCERGTYGIYHKWCYDEIKEIRSKKNAM